MSYELDFALTDVAPARMQSWSLSMSASYSASLLDHKNSNLMAYSIFYLTGGLITEPAPHPILVDEPSTCGSQPSCLPTGGLVVHSIMKSVKA